MSIHRGRPMLYAPRLPNDPITGKANALFFTISNPPTVLPEYGSPTNCGRWTPALPVPPWSAEMVGFTGNPDWNCAVPLNCQPPNAWRYHDPPFCQKGSG